MLPVGGSIALDLKIPVAAPAHIGVMSQAVVGGVSRAMVLAMWVFGGEFGARQHIPVLYKTHKYSILIMGYLIFCE